MADIDFSKLFHQSSKNILKGRRDTAKDFVPPAEWLTTYYKTYSRYPRIRLPRLSEKSADFFDVLKNRRSQRDFSERGLTRSEISDILGYGCGLLQILLSDGRPRRSYPSAGGRYPVETYLMNMRSSDELSEGLYHYHVRRHDLELLRKKNFTAEERKNFFTDDFIKTAGAVLLFTAVFWRNQDKYGERGYRYILFEAGHIGQNIYLLSSALGLKCCVVGTHDKEVESALDIDGIGESFLYAIALGT